MSALRILTIRILILCVLSLNISILYAQEKETDIQDIIVTEIDTSAYIPLIYSGALDYNLMVAASKGYATEVQNLIDRGADIEAETEEGATPLIFSVTNNHLHAVLVLLNNNVNINHVTSNSETALLIAIKNRNFEITESLIRAGADIDYQDRNGATALHHASLYGFLEIADLLLYYGASTEIKSVEGTTPLMASVMAGIPDITEILIREGANMETRDNNGYTPFLMAAFYGDTLLMDMLLTKGVNIHAVNNNNHNAVTLTIIGNHMDAFTYLLKRDNNWNDNGRGELNPYNVASKYNRKEFVSLLESYNIPGRIRYEIDQINITASFRFSRHDLYQGINISFKEPFLNGGIIAGCDFKMFYSRLLLKKSENLFYQYMDKGAVAYIGVFKDHYLFEKPDKLNVLLSTSLMAGYSFGNRLKGTLQSPGNKMIIIPSVALKFAKMNITVITGLDYIKSSFYKNGPIWLRIGCSYNYYFDNIRTQVKSLKWN